MEMEYVAAKTIITRAKSSEWFGMDYKWYLNKLDELFPSENLRQKYEQHYGTRYQCTSPRAKQLWHIFATACDKSGILYRMPDIISGYKSGYQGNQLRFF